MDWKKYDVSFQIFVPDDLKDDRYWARRIKNNTAAKRSREARRLKENQITMRTAFLEKENALLKTELKRILVENESLKSRVEKYEAICQKICWHLHFGVLHHHFDVLRHHFVPLHHHFVYYAISLVYCTIKYGVSYHYLWYITPSLCSNTPSIWCITHITLVYYTITLFHYSINLVYYTYHFSVLSNHFGVLHHHLWCSINYLWHMTPSL